MALTCYFPMDILLMVATFVCAFYWYFRFKNNYWTYRGVPCVKPHWFFGSFRPMFVEKKTWLGFCEDLYKGYKEVGLVGITMVGGRRAVFILDPRLIETVLVQDFSCFHDRTSTFNSKEPLSNSLPFLRGQKWHTMRYKLAPAFSSGQIKRMYDQLAKCSDSVVKRVEKLMKAGEDVEVESLISTFTAEAIASCTFGLQLQNDSDLWEEYLKVTRLSSNECPKFLVKSLVALMYPKMAAWFNIHTLNKHVSEFFTALTRSSIKHREQSTKKRDDFMQLFLSLKEQEQQERKSDIHTDLSRQNKDTSLNEQNLQPDEVQCEETLFSESFIAAMMFNFLSGGYGVTISTISFALYELARNATIQARVQEEIDTCIGKHGGLMYEAVKDMIYLDQVIQETLRLHTPTSVITREVTAPYKFPVSGVELETGSVVFIPVAALHMDPQIYPAPEEFTPERFSDNNFKSSSLYLPFGHGPRICIAIKFSVLMAKACLARILSKFSVRLGGNMELPLRVSEGEAILKTEGGMWLSFLLREEF